MIRKSLRCPESSEFQDADLRKLITGGTYGSGAFGLYAKLLFLRDDRPEMKPRGLKKLDGSKDDEQFLKYDFSVDRDRKMFTMSDGGVTTNVGFKGAIYADPNTLDLRRIELELTQLPKEFRIKSAADEVDYGRVQIGDDRFLLPVANVLTTAGPGGKSRNQVQFAKCRKFQGESTISFLDPSELEAQEAQQVREVMLPSNTDLEIVLDSELAVDDLETNAVGGIVTGKINRAVRVNGEELIPKDATANGRIVRLERYATFYALEMRFTDISWNGGHAGIRTRLFNVPFPDRLALPAQQPLQLPPNLSGELVIRLAKPAPAYLRGLLTVWKTY